VTVYILPREAKAVLTGCKPWNYAKTCSLDCAVTDVANLK